MGDLLESLLSDAVTDSAINAATDAALATTETSEEPIWELVDMLLQSGVAESLLAATGAPVVIVIGFKVFKKWRQKQKKAA